MSLKSFNMPRSIVATMLAGLAGFGLLACATPARAGSLKDAPTDANLRAAVLSVTSKKVMDAPDGKFNGDKPVTRYELAVTLDRLIHYIEQGRTPLHPTKRQHAAKLPSTATGPVKEALNYLTTNNFIDDSSFLLKGSGGEVVTANQLRDVLSQVTIRISDRAVAPQSN